jgi:hypothetical protein
MYPDHDASHVLSNSLTENVKQTFKKTGCDGVA